MPLSIAPTEEMLNEEGNTSLNSALDDGGSIDTIDPVNARPTMIAEVQNPGLLEGEAPISEPYQIFKDKQVLPMVVSKVDASPTDPMDLYKRTLDKGELGFTKIPTNVPEVAVDGSLFAASFRNDNSLGAIINNRAARVASPDYERFNPFQFVPPELVDYQHLYAVDSNIEEVEETTAVIRQELRDKQLLAKYPLASFATSFATQALDPVNLLPGSIIYKNYKRQARTLQSLKAASASAVVSGTVQEGILNSQQQTRTLEESALNVLAGAIVAGGLGASIGAIGARTKLSTLKYVRAKRDVVGAITDKELELTPDGLINDNDIENMPAWVQKTMKIGPLNTLMTSPFGTAKKFAQQIFEVNYNVVKNARGETEGNAVETLMKTRLREIGSAQAGYQDIYFKYKGVESGIFKKTRAALNKEGMSFDEFDDAVSLVITSGVADAEPAVNMAAKHLEEKVIKPIAADAIELGLLPKDVQPENAVGYFTTIYNKNLIIEQGGRSARGPGTLPQALFDYYKNTEQKIENYKKSPQYQQGIKDINQLRRELKSRKIVATEPSDNQPMIDELKAKVEVNSADIKSNFELVQKYTADIKDKLDQIKEFKAKRKRISKMVINEHKTIEPNASPFLEPGVKEKEAISKLKQLDGMIEAARKYVDRAKEARDVTKRIIRKTAQVLKANNKSIEYLSRNDIKTSADNLNARLSQRRAELKDNIAQTRALIQEHNKMIADINKQKVSVNLLLRDVKLEKQKLSKRKRGSHLHGVALRRISELEAKISTKRTSIADMKSVLDAFDSPKKRAQRLREARSRIKSSIEMLGTPPKKLTKKEKAAIKDKIADIKRSLLEGADRDMLTSDGSRLRKAVDDNIRWEHVEQTIDTILGQQNGQLLNPILDKIGGGRTSPLHARSILADQVSMRPWHVRSAAKVTNLYARGLVPVIELERLARQLGAESWQEAVSMVEASMKKEFDEAMKGKTGKEAADLNAKYLADLETMKNSIALVKGIYGSGPNTIDNKAAIYYRNFLKWNAVRLLGSMTLSSIPDIALQILRHGPMQFIFDGLIPQLRNLNKLAKEDLRAIGYGMETQLGIRLKSFSEHESLSSNPGLFSKALDNVFETFGNASLINQWNSFGQDIAGTISINRTLNLIHDTVEGRAVSVKDIKRVAQLGIDRKYFDYIYEQTRGMIDESGARYAGWNNWEARSNFEADALREFKGSVAKEIDSIIIVPGLGDKPLIAHRDAGKFIFQFKSFMFAATNKITYSTIQRRRDAEVYTGIVSMLAMGAVSYAATQLARGEEIDTSFDRLANEAIDRSGIAGVFMEVYNIGQKIGVFPGETVSRYRSRDFLGSLVGPAGGLVSESVGILTRFTGVSKGETDITTGDVKSFLRLIPYQNLFYLARLNKAIVTAVGDTFDLRETRPDERKKRN